MCERGHVSVKGHEEGTGYTGDVWAQSHSLHLTVDVIPRKEA